MRQEKMLIGQIQTLKKELSKSEEEVNRLQKELEELKSIHSKCNKKKTYKSKLNISEEE